MATIYTRNGKRFNVYSSQTIDEVTYPNFLDASVQAQLGIVTTEIADPPEGFDLTYWTVQELDEAPFIKYEKKDEATRTAIWNERIDQQIDSMERQFLMPRATREFMLVQFAALAQSQGIDPMTNIGYAKVKQFDDQIAALRASKK